MQISADALALTPAFLHPQNWHVIVWIKMFWTAHWRFFAFWGLRWLALSIFLAVAWSIFMTVWGHPRDDDKE